MTTSIFSQKDFGDFKLTCKQCGSEDVEIKYTFRYYGGYTGWEQDLCLECRACCAFQLLTV